MATSITLYFDAHEKIRFQQAAARRGMSGAVFARWCMENAHLLDTSKPLRTVEGSTSGRKAVSIRSTPELSALVANNAQGHDMTTAIYALWLIENADHINASTEIVIPGKPKSKAKPWPKGVSSRAVLKQFEVEDRTTSPILEAFVGTWSIDELAEFTGRTVQEIVDYAYSAPN